ncbi:MAG: hypothetical protein KU38_04120 [Sulfurovum sp. FS08-3]|nr:MAG: hypothetical protein KU38_04120 [Sulfurovum sp. FS08-3]
MLYQKKIWLGVLIGGILLHSCTKREATTKAVSTKYATNPQNYTLDYEDAMRDRCNSFPQDGYRYKNNSDYRNGWDEASKKC